VLEGKAAIFRDRLSSTVFTAWLTGVSTSRGFWALLPNLRVKIAFELEACRYRKTFR